MRIQNLKGYKKKRGREKINKKRKFKDGKVCEICKQPEGKGKEHKLTVHNHRLPDKFWMIFCRKCHDKVHGIERNNKNEIIHWWGTNKEDWYDNEQGWYEETTTLGG